MILLPRVGSFTIIARSLPYTTIMERIITTKFIKKNGKLVSVRSSEKIKLNDFVASLPEGQYVEAFMQASDSNGTYTQLSMIHACIRKIASELGYSFDDMKLLVKAHSGMVNGKTVRSLRDCSKEDLSLVINTITEIAEEHNISLDHGPTL